LYFEMELLFEGFSCQSRGQDSDQILDHICNHPGLEEPTRHVLGAGLALMLALVVHAFLILRNLKIESLEVVAGIKKEHAQKAPVRWRENTNAPIVGPTFFHECFFFVSSKIPAESLQALLKVVETGNDFFGLLVRQGLGHQGGNGLEEVLPSVIHPDIRSASAWGEGKERKWRL